MKPSFLTQPPPVMTGIFAGQTPQELIAEARTAEFAGARGIAIDLSDVMPEFRNRASLKPVIDSVHLPFMFFFYRNDRQQNLDDNARQDVLLAAADAGAAMIDVMGDLYDPSPTELTHDAEAIDKQKRLIDAIHRRGVDVVMSSHLSCSQTTEQVLRHAQELKSRGPDVVKIVTCIDTDNELAEAFRTTLALKRELKTPFIHLCSGAFSRPHRFLCPALGVSIFFAVPRYDPRYGMAQPTLTAMKAVLDNLHWNINEVM
jgi:3-dehydroquinate dehydratase